MYTYYTDVHLVYRRTLSIQTYTYYTDVHLVYRRTRRRKTHQDSM